jgi:signal peptidase II
MPARVKRKQVRLVTKWVLFCLIAGIVCVADQMSKQTILQYIPVDRGFELVPGYVNLVHVRNPGAAFGLLSRADWDFRKLFFVVVSVAALVVIVSLFVTSQDIPWGLSIGYALFFGGALGNLVDRIRFGEVIDFLDLHWGPYHWPAFNVADSALCVGVALFAMHIILTRDKASR